MSNETIKDPLAARQRAIDCAYLAGFEALLEFGGPAQTDLLDRILTPLAPFASLDARQRATDLMALAVSGGSKKTA